RIDAPGHVDVVVAEILRDLLHRHAIFGHAHRRRVPQHVWRDLADVGAQASGFDPAVYRGHALARPFDHEVGQGAAVRLYESDAQAVRHRYDRAALVRMVDGRILKVDLAALKVTAIQVRPKSALERPAVA